MFDTPGTTKGRAQNDPPLIFWKLKHWLLRIIRPLYILFFVNFHNSLTFKGLCPPLISSSGQSHEYSIFSRAKTFNQKSYFCSEFQCRNSKFSEWAPPDPPLKGEGRGDVNKTFMTRPRSRPNVQDQDKDQDLRCCSSKTFYPRPRLQNPNQDQDQDLTDYDSEFR